MIFKNSANYPTSKNSNSLETFCIANQAIVLPRLRSFLVFYTLTAE